MQNRLVVTINGGNLTVVTPMAMVFDDSGDYPGQHE
jgi:hypothetical protein